VNERSHQWVLQQILALVIDLKKGREKGGREKGGREKGGERRRRGKKGGD